MDWQKEFEKRHALWHYTEKDKYHVKTSKNVHTDLYLNTDYLVSDPRLINQVVRMEFLPEINRRDLRPDWVITYPPYGIPVAYEIASTIGTWFGYVRSRWEKETYFNINEDETILIAADDVYSGGSIRSLIEYFIEKRVKISSVLFCLGNFSNSDSILDVSIISAIKAAPNFWSEDECPMCKNGSTAVYHRANWAKLHFQE